MSIKFENVSYVYNSKTEIENKALNNINLELPDRFFIALIGQTGSGKSTLIQQINGLLKPTEGKVIVDDFVVSRNKKERTKKINNLRKNVGYLFQFSEAQLFEETVLKDVKFGPLNYGATKEEAEILAKEALQKVGLDESFYERSPFELSGGEKRRVSLAGVIAFKPKYLILDEPTAGLDQRGIENTMKLLLEIYKSGTNIILITHDMDLAFKYCDDILILENGEVKTFAKKLEAFKSYPELHVPNILKISAELERNGLNLDLNNIYDIDSFISEIKRVKHNGK